jgi:polyadenylation factor subunit 2
VCISDFCEMYEDHGTGGGGGSKEAQPAYRKHLTAFNSVVNVLEQQCFTRNIRDRRLLQPHYQHMRYVTTPTFNRHNPADPICSHFLLHGFNRLQKAPVHAGCWSSDGRRLVLGTQLGEFNLWEVRSSRYLSLSLSRRVTHTNSKNW